MSGNHPHSERDSDVRWHSGATALALLGVIAGYAGAPWWAPALGALFGASVVARSSWESIRTFALDINLLMIIAAVLSAVMGLWQEAAVLLFLFALSSTLEEFALGRTRAAVDALAKLRPDEVILLEGEQERRIPVEEVKPGDLVRILPYSQVAVDGLVERGTTSIDEATITGESVPVSKTGGDRVLAGTQNLEGSLVVRATAASGDTHLQKVVEALRQAQEHKSQSEKISVWFGSRYTVAVLGFFLLSLAVRMLVFHQAFSHALFLSLASFVALSPCALVLASPAASLSALAYSARKGVLVRGGAVFEQAAEVNSAIFDKTGTLTTGHLSLSEVIVRTPEGELSWSEGQEMPEACQTALSAAASMESQCVHPIADAIVRSALRHQAPAMAAEEVEVLPGAGVKGVILDQPARIGQATPEDLATLKLCGEGGVRSLARMDWAGGTAWFCMKDELRPEIHGVIDELKGLGIKEITILSGDSEVPVKAASAAAGLENYHAGLSPIEKERFVAEWTDSGRVVMMVGDGVNDAPSLARARLGVAMGDLGADIALGSADAVLATGKLTGLPLLIRLGRRTRHVIRQGLAFAVVVAFSAWVMSLTADLWPAHLQRQVLPIAVVMHEGSTVVAILSGLRLLRGP